MDAYRVTVKRPPEFLAAILEAVCGEAMVSFEGDLAVLRDAGLPGMSITETARLRRHTIAPTQEFAVVPVRSDTLPAMVSLCGRLGLRSRVLHVQIEEGGDLGRHTSVFLRNPRMGG